MYKIKVVGIAAFCAVLFGCAAISCVAPQREYSEMENRSLEQKPEVSWEDIQTGDYQEHYEKYLTDQMFLRDVWVDLAVTMERLEGKREINGVYIGKDGYLLEKYDRSDFEDARVAENIGCLSGFLNDAVQMYGEQHVACMMLPSKANAMPDRLPDYARMNEETDTVEELGRQLEEPGILLDVGPTLREHQDEYIYYRTDHHWTTLGAYYAYGEWARQMGFSAVPQESFKVTDVTDAFLGTSYAKVRTGGRADSISLYEANDGQAYEVDYNRGEFQSDSFYDRTKLQGEDPYSVFFGGNQAIVDIRLASKDADGRTLLLVKDSFGNCFAPFVAAHYARTIVIDLRYVNIPVSKLMQAYPVDDILILYNTVQFMEDRDISKLQ